MPETLYDQCSCEIGEAGAFEYVVDAENNIRQICENCPDTHYSPRYNTEDQAREGIAEWKRDRIENPASGGLPFIFDDGGRARYGFKGSTGDCVTRAIAIATRIPYLEVYDKLNKIAENERTGKRKKKTSNARTGVFKYTYKRFLKSVGWVWTPTRKFGSGCTTHLRPGELPQGRLIAKVSRHLCAVIDGVIHDTHDPSREGTRCVYGYFHFPL